MGKSKRRCGGVPFLQDRSCGAVKRGGASTVEVRGSGPVATCVGIDWRIFGRHEAIRSCGEVNDLIVWFLGEGLPSVDLAHGDLS